jgi:hypothetical protein
MSVLPFLLDQPLRRVKARCRPELKAFAGEIAIRLVKTRAAQPKMICSSAGATALIGRSLLTNVERTRLPIIL